MRLFEFASLTLDVDNPGGEWLKKQQEQCRSEGENKYGAPSRFGPVTASFSRGALVPVNILSRIDGVMGEQGFVREEDFVWLRKEMGTNNRLPLGNSGNQYKPFIQVDYTGTPWINEGNHRIKVAKDLGWEYLPVEVRYFSGGETANGLFSPVKLNNWDSTAISAGYKPGNEFHGKITK